MTKLLSALAFVSATFCLTTGSNILGIFNYPSKSHHILGEALLKGLARRGHNVTMVSPFGVAKVIPNYTHVEVDEVLKYKEEKLQDFFQGRVSILQTILILPAFNQLTPIFLESRQFQELLRSNSTFDVIIGLLGISDVLLGVGDHFKAPMIGFAPVGGIPMIDSLMGNPSPYSYVPNVFSAYTDDMNFIQRVANTLFGLGTTFLQKLRNREQNQHLKKYFPNSPPIEELIDNISLMLVNSHISTETARPYLPNVIQIGGFHIQEEPEALSEDLQQFLDAAEEGVVYLSFGTNVMMSELSPEILAAFLEAFRKTSLKVLWKYESDETLEQLSNVRFVKWVPQRGVLAHRNVKVFITHGGMGSTAEALYYGVPLVCIPFFGDQDKNCADVIRYGMGKLLRIQNLTADLVYHALEEILSDDRYAANAKLRSELYKEQPIKPMDHAIYWVEHVIKHKGAKHLQARSVKLAWYQLLLLDVAAFLIAVLSVIIFTFYCLVKMALKKCTQKSARKTKLN